MAINTTVGCYVIYLYLSQILSIQKITWPFYYFQLTTTTTNSSIRTSNIDTFGSLSNCT
jgi:hypothetical protein